MCYFRSPADTFPGDAILSSFRHLFLFFFTFRPLHVVFLTRSLNADFSLPFFSRLLRSTKRKYCRVEVGKVRAYIRLFYMRKYFKTFRKVPFFLQNLFYICVCARIRVFGGENERKIVLHMMCIDALQMHQHQQCRPPVFGYTARK